MCSCSCGVSVHFICNSLCADEQHIQHLQDASKEIKAQSTVVENTTLYEAVEQWCQLNQLLCVSLSAKHGLELSSLQPEPAKTESDCIERSKVVGEVPEVIFILSP